MPQVQLANEETPDRLSTIKRRLAAIAFADIAGFSRLMAVDEVETVRRWRELRSQIMEPHMARHGGRVAEIAGDAVLVEFPSAVNAVRWAVDVQRSQQTRSNEPDPAALRVRIGINVEDVIDDDGILQGDGVNIAARIHQAAEPGQIVVTAAVRDYVMNRLPVAFHDLGMPSLKNIVRPVRVFAIEWIGGQVVPHPYLQWSTRPTIAVLPFRTIGGTDDDSYFGDGITDEIITGLSRSRSLFVIARSSTLRYRDRQKDSRQIASELDVRYILDGSVRRQGTRLRINTELIDMMANRARSRLRAFWTVRRKAWTLTTASSRRFPGFIFSRRKAIARRENYSSARSRSILRTLRRTLIWRGGSTFASVRAGL